MLFDLSTSDHRNLFLGKAPWEVLSALREYVDSLALGTHLGIVSPKATLVHPEKIFLAKGSVIHPGALIEGPCVVGEGSVVGHCAYLRPYTLLGKGCVVGHASEVKHSIFLDGAKAPHFNYVGDSILGNGVNLGAGAICANIRHDRQPVRVLYNGARFDTGLRKLGALIGDGAQIGCNCVTNPGAILPKGARMAPCTSGRGGYAEPTQATL